MNQRDDDKNAPSAAWTTLLSYSDADTKVIPIIPGDYSTAMIFKRVPAALVGFPMGSRSIPDAQPVTRVVIDQDYWIGAFPITQLQWRQGVEWIQRHLSPKHKEFASINELDPDPSYFKGDYLPVEEVSWDDVQLWLQGIRELVDFGETKLDLRLPYEAEWEWACRAVQGADGKYLACNWEFNGVETFGDGEPALDRCGWYRENSKGSTHRVGLKEANPLGLYDMHGNVFEWCMDRLLENYNGYWDGITMQEVIDVNNTCDARHRVFRGGGWDYSAWGCQSALRSRWWPAFRNRNRGFRVGLFPGPNRASASKAQADSEQRREAETLRDSAESQRADFTSISLPPRSGRNF